MQNKIILFRIRVSLCVNVCQYAIKMYFIYFVGFFTVDKTFSSNLFFWYFPSENDFEHAPIILWLQGGPGDTSLVGKITWNIKIQEGHLCASPGTY